LCVALSAKDVQLTGSLTASTLNLLGEVLSKHSTELKLEAIVDIIRDAPEGVSIGEIESRLPKSIPRRTLQYRLKRLVDDGRLERQGERRWTRYRALDVGPDVLSLPVSAGGQEIRAYLRRAFKNRRPAGYDRNFLERYRPNESFYLTEQERAELHRVGTPRVVEQPAGTYARQLLERLVIDLSWNSSRLEGNTYSLLDTRRLLAFSQEAEGKETVEASMILNHKDAIEFLVASIEDIGFNRYSIQNLHALLAHNLLPDPAAPGRLRQLIVGIGGSTFLPLEVPALIAECFDQLLSTAEAIRDPFEQAFFVMVQLPYLQPFDHVNKRVSRLAANIPFIRANLCPLSFTDVPTADYTQAILGVYELRRVDLLRDVFVWAYKRSAERYAAVRQSLGEPDPFRLRHRNRIHQVVTEVVRARLGRRAALKYLQQWAAKTIDVREREQLREVVESELLSLHEGNFARYRIRPSEFEAWSLIWQRR